MFWHKNKYQDNSLIIFSAIAFLIILSVVFVLVIFLNKVDSLKGSIKSEAQNLLLIQTTPKLLVENYRQDMTKLYTDIEAMGDDPAVFDLAEEVFFSVKVPKEMMDDHLQTFLKINSLKDSKGKNADVIVLLDELIKKINLNYEENSN